MHKNTMKTSKRRALAVGLALFVVSMAMVVVRPVTASAAGLVPDVWTGTNSGAWSDPANWNPAVVPVAGDSLTFPVGALNPGMTDDLPAGRVNFSTITFNAPGYSVTPLVPSGVGAQTIGAVEIMDNSAGAGTFTSIDIPVEFDSPALVTASVAGHTLTFNTPGNTSASGGGVDFFGPGVIKMAWNNPGIVDPVTIDGNAVVLDDADTGLGINTITVNPNVGAPNGQLFFFPSLGFIETVANPIILNGTGPVGSGALETQGADTVTLSGLLTIQTDSTVFASSLSHLDLTGALAGSGALTINGPGGGSGGFVTIAGSSPNNTYAGGPVSVDNAELDLNDPGGTALGNAAVVVGSAGGVTDVATLNFLRADQLTATNVLNVNNLGTATTEVNLNASTHETVNSLALGPVLTNATTPTKFDASGTTNLVVTAAALGSINLSGATLNQTLVSTPPAGTPFDIITNNGANPVVGTFAGLAEGNTFTVSGTVLTISYVGAPGGHSVTLTPAPAPPPPPPPPVGDTLAVRGADNGLWVKTGTQGYQGLGGQLLAAPSIASLGSGDHLYVVLGMDHQLYQRTDHAGYQVAGTPGTYCLDNPAVFVTGGNATVACMGGDHELFVNHGTVDNGGVFHPGGWLAEGGYLNSGPSVAFVEGQLHYFVEGRNHIVYDRTDATGYAARPWACIGHQGVANSAGQAYFTCHGLDGQAWAAVNAGTGWSDAQPLGGQLVDGTAVAAHAGGATLFVEGVGQGAWSISIDTNGHAAGGWSSLGGQCVGGTGAST